MIPPNFEKLSRRGLALMWTLVILAVVTVVMGAMSLQFLAGRRVLEKRQDRLQAVWLARAGVELAAAHLLTSPANYRETVEIVPGSQVRIEVQGEEKSPDTFLVTSEARYPKDSQQGMVQSLSHRFHRTTEKGEARIEVLPPLAPEKKEGSDRPGQKETR